MLTRTTAGSLISGGSGSDQTRTIRMLVKQSVKGKMKEAGEIVEAPAQDAGWLVRSKFAEYVECSPKT